MTACRQCLDALTPLPAAANLGFVYVTEPLAVSLDLIVAMLRDATGVESWVAAGGTGVCASGVEYFDGGAIVALVTSLPANSFGVVNPQLDGSLAGNPNPEQAREGRAGQIERLRGRDGSFDAVGLGVIHGAADQLDVVQAIADLSSRTGAFLVGGLASAGEIQIAGQPAEGGLSGVVLNPDVPVITSLSQGCSPIGPAREVTDCRGPWIKTLDGRPAVAALKEDVGEVLARDLSRIAGYIHAAIPVSGLDRADYLVRNLLAVDALGGSVAVGNDLRRGDPIMFVKRDGGTAQADLRRMLQDLSRRAEGRTVRGALYHSCVARGPHMFGPESAELRAIEEVLGPVPLAGFFTGSEFFGDRLYTYTGVLTLFL